MGFAHKMRLCCEEQQAVGFVWFLTNMKIAFEIFVNFTNLSLYQPDVTILSLKPAVGCTNRCKFTFFTIFSQWAKLASAAVRKCQTSKPSLSHFYNGTILDKSSKIFLATFKDELKNSQLYFWKNIPNQFLVVASDSAERYGIYSRMRPQVIAFLFSGAKSLPTSNGMKSFLILSIKSCWQILGDKISATKSHWENLSEKIWAIKSQR